MKPIHPLYQQIIESLVGQDTRDFQVPPQQRIMTALNYLHMDDQKQTKTNRP